MRPADFHYDLPPELIAQVPLPERAASRLLVLDAARETIEDRRFPDLVHLLAPGDLLVMNDTRVVPARMIGRKPTGGRVELLLERVTGPREARVQIGARRALAIGARIGLPGGGMAEVLGREGPFYRVGFDRDVISYLESHGQVPLPPYIEREPDQADRERYQTVFAERPGAVAAPTAGLHFDQRLLSALRTRGVEQAFVTLHVGAGTFAPVRASKVEEHRLHAERVEVSAELCRLVDATHRRGGQVVAVGTTVVRALEAAAAAGRLVPFTGDTRLFIYPGYRFRVVDAMVTNFHLPESSLLMLVAAFAGRERTLAAYRHAVAQRYRFFSYGDAMFVRPKWPRTGERADAL
jgi:S-adenosylmethionine:tRNA ribosyltransferase-isomerase